MGLNTHVMREGYVPAYQTSAVPYITSSVISAGEVQEISFNQVTRFFKVQNVGTVPTDEIAVGVTLRGLGAGVGNFFTLPRVSLLGTSSEQLGSSSPAQAGQV